MIVHRKGATPAGLGVLGIIPGSMAAPGLRRAREGRRGVAPFGVARGGPPDEPHPGEADSSRGPTRSACCEERGVTLLSAGLDEVPMAYKDIDEVMAAQRRPRGDRRALQPAPRQDGARRRAAGGLIGIVPRRGDSNGTFVLTDPEHIPQRRGRLLAPRQAPGDLGSAVRVHPAPSIPTSSRRGATTTTARAGSSTCRGRRRPSSGCRSSPAASGSPPISPTRRPTPSRRARFPTN